MPRKGENIYKRKDGRWEGRYIKGRSETGKAVYGYVYAHSYRDVKSKLSLSSKAPSQIQVISANSQISIQTKTFGDLADLWMKSIQPQVKESTFIKYQNSLKNYILPVLGDKQLGDISFSCLEEFVSTLLTSGGNESKGLSSKTVTDTLSIIRVIIQHADKHGFVVACSGRGISVKQESKELIVLTATEQKQLQQYLYNNLSDRNLGILVCLFTGIRIGEICALKWDDISFTEKHIKIQRTMQRIQCDEVERKTKIIITTPKSKCSLRTIPLPDIVIERIEKDFQNREGYVLTGQKDIFVEPRTMQNHFKRVLEECKIRNVNYHVLRHTFATRCIELGFDIKSLSEILGHASVNITMNRYVHPSMELKRENMNKLNNLFTVK